MSHNLPAWHSIPGWGTLEPLYQAQVDRVAPDAHVVEVGTGLGRSAALMATLIAVSGKPIQLDTIDAWTLTANEAGADMWRVFEAEKSKYRGFHAAAQAHLKPFINHLTLKTGQSLEAAMHYAPKSLDFVCLDGDYRAAYIARELEAWWPCLKPNGVVAGRNWQEVTKPGVKIAVQAWAKRTGYKVHLKDESYWWIINSGDERTVVMNPDYRPILFPAWRFHPTLDARIVDTPEEDAALGPEWSDTAGGPPRIPVMSAVEVAPDAVVPAPSASEAVSEPVPAPEPRRRRRRHAEPQPEAVKE